MLLRPSEGCVARALTGPLFLACGTAALPFGGDSFPSVTSRNVNNVLRAILKQMELPHAEQYSSHGFRRWEASELQTTGSQWSTVATIGDWRSLAFKGYVDWANELARDLSRLLVEDIVLGEEDADYVRSLGGGQTPLWPYRRPMGVGVFPSFPV